RLLTWLRIAGGLYPEYALYAANAAARWNVCAVPHKEGRLQGMNMTGAGPQPYRHTASGYERYAVQGYRAWGLAVPPAKPLPPDATLDIYGQSFPPAADPAATPPVFTAPYALLG